MGINSIQISSNGGTKVLVTESLLIMAEGSLEVKLPTIWTDGKAEVGTVREEKKRSEDIREERKRERESERKRDREEKNTRSEKIREEKEREREREREERRCRCANR